MRTIHPGRGLTFVIASKDWKSPSPQLFSNSDNATHSRNACRRLQRYQDEGRYLAGIKIDILIGNFYSQPANETEQDKNFPL